MVQPFFDLFALSIASLVFLVLSIIVPGFFIWLGFKVLGRERGILKCGLANFAAFFITAILSFLLSLTPVALILPILAFLIYLYTMKTLLDVSFLEALGATIIAAIVVILVSFVVMLLFGVWMLSTPPHMHFRF